MWKDKIQYLGSEIFRFLTNKAFLKNILGMIALMIVVIFGLLTWLRFYTNHGQKLEMPNYIEQSLAGSQKDAKKRSFEIIVNDSVHIVGKTGGIIQNQNPPGGSMVKEKRKVYVTITKYQADVVDLADAFPLYGQDYELKKSELQRKSIYTEIKEFRYDPLTNNTILEVWNGNEIIVSSQLDPKSIKLEKGTTLSFVLSSPEGGSHDIPDITGNTLKNARWIVERNMLRIGQVNWEGEEGNLDEAEVVKQTPLADGISSLTTGSSIDVVVKKRQ